ncbi:MAG: hypothetical protein ACRDKX_02445 [Solirubrobacterales bacterium]
MSEGAVIADRSRFNAWDADFDPLAVCRRLGKSPSTSDEDATEDLSAAPLLR